MKSYRIIVCFGVALSLCSACTLEDVKEYGDFCPPKIADNSMERVKGKLAYIGEKSCTEKECSLGSYDFYFKNQKCPPAYQFCVQGTKNKYHCAGETACTDSQFLCKTEESPMGFCVDPTKQTTCGAVESACEDGAPYGGVDCSQFGAAICNDDLECECIGNALQCDDQCIDPSAPETCGANDCSLANFGGDNCNTYDNPRVCTKTGDTYKCMCAGGFILKNGVCVDPNDVLACDENECRSTLDGITECVNQKTRCGKNCLNCTYIHENASCLNGTCVITECLPNEHPVFTGTQITDCLINSPTECAPQFLKLSEQPVNCNDVKPENAALMDCSNEGECFVAACEPGFQIDPETGGCKANTVTNCGTEQIDCNTVMPENALTMICDSGICHVQDCSNNTHVSFDKASCQPNIETACAVSFSSETKDCSLEMAENAMSMTCENGSCLVAQCLPGYHIDDDRLSCVPNSNTACSGSNSTVPVDCTQNLPANARERTCESGVCKVTSCANNYHISVDRNGCEANSNSACGASNSNVTTNCNANLPANATGRTCQGSTCKVTSCSSNYHVRSDQSGCEINSSSACGGSSWNGGNYNSYVRQCSGAQSQCMNGSCQCPGYPNNVLNYDGNACVPSVCQGIPGVSVGSVQTFVYFNHKLSENGCHADACNPNYKIYQQDGGSMCRPSSSVYTCSNMGYKYQNGGYCWGCNGSSSACAHGHCAAGYRYYLMACLPAKYCCGTRDDYNMMSRATNFACRNCVAEGYSDCDVNAGKCI